MKKLLVALFLIIPLTAFARDTTSPRQGITEFDVVITDGVQYIEADTEPSGAETGDCWWADGSGWNPGGDGTAGVFCYNGSSWEQQGGSGGGGSGDVTAVGDCTGGACLDGSSDGGQYIRLYDGAGYYLEQDVAALSANTTVTFPAVGGTVFIRGDTDLAIADGGTGSGTASAARTALGLAIGSDVQAYDAQLADLADGTITGDFVNTANPWAINEGGTGSATASAARTALGLAIGSDVQAYDAQLSDLADGTLTGDFVNTANPWAINELHPSVITSTELTAALIPSNLGQAGASTGQPLEWNGTQWAPGVDSGAGTTVSVAFVTISGDTGGNSVADQAEDTLTIAGGNGIDTLSSTNETITISAETATATNPGVVELATAAEVTAASDTTRAVTPESLESGFDGSTNIVTTGTIATGAWNADDIPLSAGGTGESLSDPGADRGFFWDDSGGAVEWLIYGTGFSISGNTITSTGSAPTLNEITNPTGNSTLALTTYKLTFTTNNGSIVIGTDGSVAAHHFSSYADTHVFSAPNPSGIIDSAYIAANYSGQMPMWMDTGVGDVVYAGTDNATFYTVVYEGGPFHDGFSDFVANEHLDWTGDLGATNIHSGNVPLAATATALAANGGNCNAGEIPLGVDASGAVESCYEPAFSDVTGAITVAQLPAAALTDGHIGVTVQAYDAQLDDISDGTLTGNFVNTANPWAVNEGGTGAATFTDGGVLLGSDTSALTAMGVLADGQMIVGDGTTDPVAESGATLRSSIGVGTADTPDFAQLKLSSTTPKLTLTDTSAGEDDWDIVTAYDRLFFRNYPSDISTANNMVIFYPTYSAFYTTLFMFQRPIELGDNDDTTIARSSAGVITVEGNVVYTAGNITSAEAALEGVMDLEDMQGTATSAQIASNMARDSELPTIFSLPMYAGLFTPVAADDDIPLTLYAPTSGTISAIDCYSWDGTTTISVSNGDSFASTNVTDGGGLVCGIDTRTTDSTLTNTTIAAGAMVAFDVSAVAGAPTRVFVGIR